MPLAGCQETGLPGTIPVRGKVTYNGKPLGQGEVRYIPVDAQTGRQARGTIDKNGNFVLSTLKKGDGALPGKYKVVVSALEPHPGEPGRTTAEPGQQPNPVEIKRGHIIPDRYTVPRATPLEDLVDENHPGYKEFKLMD